MFPNPMQPWSGVFVLEQLRHFQRVSLQASVISPVPYVPKALRSVTRWRKYCTIPQHDVVYGIPVYYPRTPMLPSGRGFFLYGFSYFVAILSQLLRNIRGDRPDLIHAHGIMPDGFAAALLGKMLRIPVICTAHGSDVFVYPYRDPLTMLATRWTLRSVERIVTVSQALKDEITEMAGPILADVVPNGVDLQKFYPIGKEQTKRRCGIASNAFVFIYVGGLVPGKGLEYLLEALSGLAAHRKAALYLVGDGVLRRDLEERARALRVADKIIFTGAKRHEEIPLWMNMADCLILPSLHEGFGCVLLEASACKCPIIATRVGGIPDIINHGENGILVEPKDAKGLADAMGLMIADSAMRASLVGRAFRRVQSLYTWSHNVETMAGIYSAVVTQGSKRSLQPMS